MLNADLTPEEREVVQKRVEMLHRAWTKRLSGNWSCRKA
jgi:hypothetical protein